jgi:pyridinium-3,5-bisthiocarboxylic acid mononucleotide nickel chelatase
VEKKTLYFECGMGAAGDMMTAGLLELLDDSARADFLKRLNNAGIPGVDVRVESAVKCGITGTRVVVSVDGHIEGDEHHHDNNHRHDDHHHHIDHHHDNNHNHDDHHNTNHHHDNDHHTNDNNHHNDDHRHNDYSNIERLVNSLRISDNAKKNAISVYKLIADAECYVHGKPVDKIHFHEVGDMDAVADIVGVCMLIDELAPAQILASPVNVGGGSVRCAHGVMPVPSPAAAYLLRGVPIYGNDGGGELCTPTGAALLKHFVGKFCNMPTISVDKIGYGMGKKDFERANCLRVYIGSVVNNINSTNGINDNSGINNIIHPNDQIAELVCTIDDMTPEAIAFAQETLFTAGAVDVYATPTVMKKGRAGIILTCLCRINDKDTIIPLIFKNTSTLGVREYIVNRHILHREQSTIQTKYGEVRIKSASGFGVKRSKPEYDDVAAIAREYGVAFGNVLKEIIDEQLHPFGHS